MANFSVLIEARPFCAFDDSPLRDLKNAGIQCIDMRGSGVEQPEFIKALKKVDAVLCGNDLHVDDAIFDKAARLKAVAKLGAGLDTVDIEAATRHGVLVFNTPGANNQAVADHTFALILSLARKIVYFDRSIRDKRWEHVTLMGTEIWQKTLGIIGLGAIGRCVALRAKGFQMKVVAYDPCWPEGFAAEHGIQQATLDELLAASDIITVHVPLTEETENLIDARALKRMKPGALLCNTARGGIINERDLYEAREKKTIAGACLDVFENEPPLDSALPALDNVVLTPHTAAFTYEGLHNMNASIVRQLVEFSRGKRPDFTVNPEALEIRRA